jgi:hypothetical protein
MPRCSVRAIAYFSSFDRRPRECVAMRNGIRQVKMSPRHSSGTQASSSRCPVAAKPPLARQPTPREALSLSDGCINHCAEQFPALQPFAWRLHHVTTNEHFLLGIDPERSAVCTTPAVVANGTSDGLASPASVRTAKPRPNFTPGPSKSKGPRRTTSPIWSSEVIYAIVRAPR